ncbi:Protein-tyrosine-phosphatase [Micrococcus terreus]|uniref:Protein-tyrosine-phosphatase n=2 Tax=Micrococcus terreus TaxID=574650 RepID=A0A1I7MN74_9MICC|nr:Protein-tyrosine-phosphatase [Micrococcus terreus]
MTGTLLFICNSNAGKSQMAGALARQQAAERGLAIAVHTAGAQISPGNPDGTTLNTEAAASLKAVGASLDGEHPKHIDPEILRCADRVIVVGPAQVEPVDGMRAEIEVWGTDEPSLRGIEGQERMTMIRDEISRRVSGLLDEFDTRPTVLFVCVHNAGRSQMAAGYLQHLAGDRIQVLSAGSAPAASVNPSAVAVMAEEGIDISAEQPKVLTTDSVRASDVVITMGCGDTCPIFPGKRYEDWELDDPAGQGVEATRLIRDDIKSRIQRLIAELDATVPQP